MYICYRIYTRVLWSVSNVKNILLRLENVSNYYSVKCKSFMMSPISQHFVQNFLLCKYLYLSKIPFINIRFPFINIINRRSKTEPSPWFKIRRKKFYISISVLGVLHMWLRSSERKILNLSSSERVPERYIVVNVSLFFLFIALINFLQLYRENYVLTRVFDAALDEHLWPHL